MFFECLGVLDLLASLGGGRAPQKLKSRQRGGGEDNGQKDATAQGSKTLQQVTRFPPEFGQNDPKMETKWKQNDEILIPGDAGVPGI